MTNNIDEILTKPYASHGEFKVPEGYLDTLQQRIMANIPEEKAATKKKPLIISMPTRLKFAIAACLTGLIVCGGVMTFNSHEQSKAIATAHAAAQKAYTSEDYARDCMDYAMVDDGDVYNYLADQD